MAMTTRDLDAIEARAFAVCTDPQGIISLGNDLRGGRPACWLSDVKEVLRAGAPAQGSWRGIESAPKDGTPVVLIGRIFYEWSNGEPVISERVYACVSGYDPEYHRRHDGWEFGAPGISTIIYPTHWQPLPPQLAPPLEGKDNE